MSEQFKLQEIKLSDADKAVIAEDKIPLGRNMFELLMHSLKLQIDNVHGHTDSYMIWYEDWEKGNLTKPDPPIKIGLKGKKKNIQTHQHISDSDKAGNTPHAAWHVLNDIYIAINEFERAKHEEKTGEPMPAPVEKPKKTLIGFKISKPIPKR
ncbi:hypothetical protein LCGC14_0268040 [marine sediment metagenome]|uniref:Uncharacterized protein n=1 Tax=marine sediment metagenome TaxID=412755 RepID=A0A0F9X4Z5_9ZZZZ